MIYRVWVTRGTGDTYEDYTGEYAEQKAKAAVRDWKNAGYRSWLEVLAIK